MRYILLQAIKDKGYTIQQVAQAVNVSQPFLTQIIKGYRNPSLEVALRISSFLDSSVEILFNYPDPGAQCNAVNQLTRPGGGKTPGGCTS